MGGMQINVDKNVYQAVAKSVRNDGRIDQAEATKIEKEIHKDGVVTADEQKLLDGLKGDKDSVLKVKFNASEPVYEITTFPDMDGSGGSISGKVDSARSADAAKEVRAALDRGDPSTAIEWLAAGGINTLSTDLSAKELNQLVKLAAEIGTMEDLLKAMGNLGPPSSWKLAQKLSPESWGLLMQGLGNMSEQDQEKFALAFGDRTRPDGSRASRQEILEDGLKKIAAISVYKAAEARAKGQTEVLGHIATGLDKLSDKLELPKPIQKMFEFYSKVLRELPNKAIDNIMDPRTSNDRSQFDSMMEEMTGNMPVMGEEGDLYPHLKEVYRGA